MVNSYLSVRIPLMCVAGSDVDPDPHGSRIHLAVLDPCDLHTVHIVPCVLLLLCYNILFVSSGYPGFITKFRGTDKVPDKPDTDTVDFENYRHVCHKWHYKENSANDKNNNIFFCWGPGPHPLKYIPDLFCNVNYVANGAKMLELSFY